MTLKPLHLFFVLISLLNLSSPLFVSSQTNPLTKVDSLKTALANAKEDIVKINLLDKLGWELIYQNPDTSIFLGKKALDLAEHLPSPKGEGLGVRSKLIANSNSDLGVYYYLKGDYPLSLSYHLKALEIRKQLNAQKGIATSLGNIGLVYYDQGDYPKALKHYFESLKIDKELGNKKAMEGNLGNTGLVYWEQANAAKTRQDIAGSNFLYAQALKYYFEALEIAKELGNKNGMARQLCNIGIIYKEQADAAKSRKDITSSDSLYAKALKHYFESLEIAKELGNKNVMAAALGNIGNVYKEQANAAKTRQDIAGSDSLYAKALKHFFDALEIDKELGNKDGMTVKLGSIGSLYIQKGRFEEAEAYLDTALAIDLEIGSTLGQMYRYEALSQLYDTTARWQLAYRHYKKYSAAKDSLFNEEKSKDIGRLEQKHEFEMAEMEMEKIEEEKSRQEAAAVDRRNLLQYSGIILCLAGLFICIFLFARRFKKIKEDHLKGGHQQGEKNYEKYVKLIEVILFISFFIFFEFLLVLLDPHLEKLTGGQPAYKLLVNAILASVIFPLHSILEAKLKASVLKSEVVSHKSGSGGSETLLLLVGFAFISLMNISFSDKTDSLKTELANAKNACPEPCLGDTTKVNLLNKLGWELGHQNPDTAILLGKQALSILTAIASEERAGQSSELSHNIQKLIAKTYNNIGVYHEFKDKYFQSISYHLKALEIRKNINDRKGIATSLGNTGNVYLYVGNYPMALKYFQESLKNYKELGNKKGIAFALNNIGIIYHDQRDYQNALKYYHEALAIDTELGNKKEMSMRTGNIGAAHHDQHDYLNAIKYYNQAMEICKELGDKDLIMAWIGNIGIVYYAQGNYANALKYYKKSLVIAKELGDNRVKAINLGNIGAMYTKQGFFKEAEQYLDSALSIDVKIGAVLGLMHRYEALSHLYDTTGRYQLAYEHYKKYSTAKDSLFNEEKSKDIGRLEQKHEYEMAEMEKERIEEEKSKQDAEAVSRRNLLQYNSIFLVLFFLFGMVFFLGKIPLPEWVVELSTFVPFMILFEFILVLLEPYIENTTGGEPLYTLLINALCAAIIFPMHSFFEKQLKARIYKIKREKEEKYAEEYRKEAEKYGNQ